MHPSPPETAWFKPWRGIANSDVAFCILDNGQQVYTLPGMSGMPFCSQRVGRRGESQHAPRAYLFLWALQWKLGEFVHGSRPL